MSFAMSRAFASSTPRTGARCSSGAARVVAPVQRAMVHRSQRRAQFVVRATEEAVVEEATSTAQESNSSDDLGPIARARAALEAESLDRPSLESVVDELESELARLQNAAAAAEARAAGLETAAAQGKDQLLRLNADFENFRRRTREEKDALAASVKGDIVTNLLPVVDNFELARTQVKAESEAEQKIQNSYQALYKQFVEFLRNLGVEAVPTVGTPFDPNFHEAIMQEPNNDMADNTVLMEFRKGFKLGDKLLRPAMVKVSTNDGTGPSSTESPTEGSSEE